jgi:hypothetical protein
MAIAGARTRLSADRLEWRIVATMVAAEAVLVALNGLNTFAWHSNFFIIENEANLPTWFSSTQLAFAAGACVLAGIAGGEWTAWGPIAAVLTFFSIDEIAMLHERFEDRVGDAAVVNVAEPVGAAIAAVVAYMIVRRLTGLTRILIVAAGAALVMAQVFSAANSALDPPYGLANVLSIGEELWEMLMGTLALAAAAPHALRAFARWVPPAASKT